MTYDLMVFSGLQNATWRTPGPDGGRDIEGVWLQSDPAMEFRQESWYVECKRYKSSVNWPTVFEKVAYASNAEADVLLVVTSAALTPNCKSEISRWNARKQRPIIQYLDGARLAARLSLYPALLVKYGLDKANSAMVGGRGVLAALVAACDSAEGDLDERFDSVGATAAFELARMVRIRSEEVDIYGKFSSGGRRDVPLPAWCDNATTSSTFPLAVRVYLSYFRFVVRPKVIKLVSIVGEKFEIETGGQLYSDVSGAASLVDVGAWCGVVGNYSNGKLFLEVSDAF